jgi:hypothetical protein
MIENLLPYWTFLRKYRELPLSQKKMVLSGQALLMLRDEPSEAIRKRLAAFITTECFAHEVPDKTLSFM